MAYVTYAATICESDINSIDLSTLFKLNKVDYVSYVMFSLKISLQFQAMCDYTPGYRGKDQC